MKKLQDHRPITFCIISLLIWILGTPVQADMAESLSYEIYEVVHKPGESLLAAINAVSPIRQEGKIFHGYTHWYVRWNFWWFERPDKSCYITTVKTQVTGKIILPSLSTTDNNVLAKFNTYIAALRNHELGHYQIGVQAAQEIEKRIYEIPTMVNCRMLEDQANRIGYQILEDFKEKEKDYDRTTQHGKTQGAWLTD